MKHSKQCQIGDKVVAAGSMYHLTTNFFNGTCFQPAKHSVVMKENDFECKAKIIYRLCDEHFFRLKNAAEAPRKADTFTDMYKAGNNSIINAKPKGLLSSQARGRTFVPSRLKFRTNRL